MDKRTKLNRIGETHKAKNGMMMTIIAYRRNDDLDIMFEDGYIAIGRSYDMFKQGRIGNPNISRSYWKRNRKIKSFRIGETNRAKNGQTMTIVAYRRCDDIDILFEDGYLAEHKSYTSFLTGEILNPNVLIKGPAIKSNRLGETATNIQGLKMTIVAYRKSEDIDIQFENGIIITTSYYYFSKGNVICPNLPRHINRLGESNTMNNGQIAEIITYRTATDLDVRFEDGTIVEHRSYRDFQLGTIKNPNWNSTDRYIGQTHLSSYGFVMKVIQYRNAHDIDILYDTGYIKTHSHFNLFKKGQCGHPFPYKLNHIIIDKPAYITQNEGHFYCHCNKCGLVDILSVNEMKNHKCETIVKPTV